MFTKQWPRAILAVPFLLGVCASSLSAADRPSQDRVTGRRYVLQAVTVAPSTKASTLCSCCPEALIFSDGFESGDLLAWSSSTKTSGEGRAAAESAAGRTFRIIPHTTVIFSRPCGGDSPEPTLLNTTEETKP